MSQSDSNERWKTRSTPAAVPSPLTPDMIRSRRLAVVGGCDADAVDGGSNGVRPAHVRMGRLEDVGRVERLRYSRL